MSKFFSILFIMVVSMSQGIKAAEGSTEEKPPLQRAMFAEGCFWRTQFVFAKVPGVVRTTVGYAGGTLPNPTYDQVCTHTTGHAECCLVEFNPKIVSFKQLLEKFFSSHDPTTLNRQGPDFGDQYRSVIFYENDEQKREALAYKNQLEAAHKFHSPIVTFIEPVGKFYTAEEYHQNYFEKHGQVCH